MEKRQKVVCAMSGGVDSSVAAALLKRQGYDVIGIFMKLGAKSRCCDLDSLQMAKQTAVKIGMPFYAVDLSKEFKREVVDYYIEEYRNARTPNPCVVCNKLIKFDLLLKKALGFGAEYLATGHYARIARGLKTKKLKLKTAKDKTKDQSYFLWTLTQKQLRRLFFPIGDYTKKEVRRMAKKWNLPAFNRDESQGTCFLGEWTNAKFLARFIKTPPGPILGKNGNVLGKHKGLPLYTIGQRKGIEIEVKKPFTPPYYVIKIDTKRNALIVGREKDLYQKEVEIIEVNWISQKLPEGASLKAKIRYGHRAAACRLSKIKSQISNLKVLFKTPQRAITPGQSIIFYKGDELLGGGIIIR